MTFSTSAESKNTFFYKLGTLVAVVLKFKINDFKTERKMTGLLAKKNKPLSKKHALRAEQLLQQGWASHRAGHIQQAESIYQSILNKYPNYPGAMHLLGLIAHQLGQYDLAITRFQQTLAIKPNFAEAHLNLGDSLQRTGRLEDAIAHFKQAISIKKDFAEAHYNLGNTLNLLGQLDNAAEHLKKAITIKPDFVDAHYNLGNILNIQKQRQNAITHFEQALAIKSDFAEGYNNLGDVLLQLGQMEEAMAHFEHAISLKPNFAEAYNNLGNVLFLLGREKEAISRFEQTININPEFALAHYSLGCVLYASGQLVNAVIHFEHAIRIKPDFAKAYNKLGHIYREQGNFVEDYNCQRHAISLDRKNDVFWASFARSLEALSFSSVDETLWQDLSELLDHPHLSPKAFTSAIISVIRCHQEFAQVLKQANSEDCKSIVYTDTASHLASIPILLKIMTLSSINDLEVERVLTVLRRSMLLGLKDHSDNHDENSLAFSAALALHSFTNEYIFEETPEETAHVEQLSNDIANLVTNDKPIPPYSLITLAAYRPLHTYSWSATIRECDYPDKVKLIIERQIRAPMEEASLRDTIPKLSPIQDSTSQTVRGQYEENPYPLWTKASLHAKASTIKDLLEASPLRFDLKDYVSPDNPEILVAGCGTGQHALRTATMFSNAKVLALDLSLTSLAYARRKTQELGISNIDYAQADIMELDKLDKHFDLIESVGVLHHLKDPLAGWKILSSLLRPGGVMKIGLYSEAARPDVISGRQLIEEKGYSTSPEDIRQCRQDIISMALNGDKGMQKIFSFSDFFHLSELRDLIFHVQEHRFTIPQIESNLKEINLEFLGFELKDQQVMQQFKTNYPEKAALTSLGLWNEFETQNPDTFRGMYQFWLRKN